MKLDNLKISLLRGSGWMKEGACGCSEKGREWQYGDLRSLYSRLLEDSVLSCPIDNFGRFNHDSRLVAFSAALALFDAGIGYARDRKLDIGIVGTSPDGCLASNLEYFRDYVTSGRTMGRGNLFIYTLPSSPLAESAIHFGLQRPLIYFSYAQSGKEKLLVQAESMIRRRDARALLAVVYDAQGAECYYLSGEGT
jgi:hypothetical protein